MPLDKFLDILDELYRMYNRRQFVSPDPLQFLYSYDDPADREVVALIASGLAYGNVRQIIASVAKVLAIMGDRPARFVVDTSPDQMRKALRGFRHRFNTGAELAALLGGLRHVLKEHGSLGRFVAGSVGPRDESILPAMTAMTHELHRRAGGPWNHLLCDPTRGSACKRLNLMMRWMSRRDDVDLGDWPDVPPRLLLVPLDTHMHRICRSLGASARNQTGVRTVLEITAAFRAIAPDDPVRYDFCLTRLGIRREFTTTQFLRYFEQAAGGEACQTGRKSPDGHGESHLASGTC
jgi:uncharacterized protein (TIGR02757 family)